MNKRQFDEKLKGIQDEIGRLTNIVEEPSRILTEFYDPFRPNLLQRLFTVMGHDAGDIYDLLIDQLGSLPVMAGCRLFKTPGRAEGPLRIHYSNPDFALIIVDIKGKRYESIYESVLRGMDANIRDAESERNVAEQSVKEMKEIDRTIRHMAGGDITFRGMRSLMNREQIKRYLRNLTYSRDDAAVIVRDLGAFLTNVQEQIDKRQAVLAEVQSKYAGFLEARKAFDESPYLKNTIMAITELLVASGYVVTNDIE